MKTPQLYLDQKKEYYQKNKEAIKAKKRAHYSQNKEERRLKTKEWRKKNPERRKELNRKYSSKPEAKAKHRIVQAYRRARQISATPIWLSISQVEEIKNIYLNCPKNFHVDHIVPLKGKMVCGLHVPWNLQCLPEIDNMKKSNKC